MDHFIVSFSRNKNQVKIDPLIGSLRSIVKAFPVYLGLWRGPQTCNGIVVSLAAFGHNEMTINLFSPGFWPAEVQCLDEELWITYTGNLSEVARHPVCVLCVYTFRPFSLECFLTVCFIVWYCWKVSEEIYAYILVCSCLGLCWQCPCWV